MADTEKIATQGPDGKGGAGAPTRHGTTDLRSLACEINREHEAAEQAINEALDHARRCGELLIEAKGQTDHGDWTPWLEEHFHGSPRTARQYMQIAREWDQIEAKRHDRAIFGIDDARKLIAESPDPDQGEDVEGEAETRVSADAHGADEDPHDSPEDRVVGHIGDPTDDVVQDTDQGGKKTKRPTHTFSRRVRGNSSIREFIRVATNLPHDLTLEELDDFPVNEMMAETLGGGVEAISTLLARHGYPHLVGKATTDAIDRARLEYDPEDAGSDANSGEGDHEPDPWAEVERLAEENGKLHELVDYLQSDDTARELTQLHDKYGRLDARLSQVLTSKAEAEKDARRRQRHLKKIRKALGVDRDREIIPAIEALR